MMETEKSADMLRHSGLWLLSPTEMADQSFRQRGRIQAPGRIGVQGCLARATASGDTVSSRRPRARGGQIRGAMAFRVQEPLPFRRVRRRQADPSWDNSDEKQLGEPASHLSLRLGILHAKTRHAENWMDAARERAGFPK